MTRTSGNSMLRTLAAQAVLATALVASATGELVVYHSDYRKTSEYDPGSMRVFLRNTGAEPVQVEQVLLDDVPIPVWGVTTNLPSTPLVVPNALRSEGMHQHIAAAPRTDEVSLQRHAHKRLIWARLRPPNPNPGEICELIVKLTNPLASPSKLSLLLADGNRVSAVVRPRPRQLVITAITFSPKLNKAYVYAQNRSDSVLTIDTTELDGTDVRNRSRWSGRSLKPGAKHICTIRPARRFRDGSYHTFKIATAAGHATAERVRARHFFPLTCEMAHPSDHAEFGLDKPPFLLYDAAIAMSDDKSRRAIASVPGGIHVLGCVMHAFEADQTWTAQEIFWRTDRCNAVRASSPTIVTPCEIRPEEGYGKFGESADIVQFNALVATSGSQGTNTEHAAQTMVRVAQYALSGASPRPTYAIVPTYKIRDKQALTSPAELRRLTFSMLGQGVKGVIYRHLDWYSAEGQALNREIEGLNAEIRRLQPRLEIADTISVATTESNDITVYSLLTPNNDIIIILVNGSKTPANDIAKVQITLPDWLVAKRLTKAGTGRLGWGRRLETARSLSLDLPTPKPATAYVLRCSPRH